MAGEAYSRLGKFGFFYHSMGSSGVLLTWKSFSVYYKPSTREIRRMCMFPLQSFINLSSFVFHIFLYYLKWCETLVSFLVTNYLSTGIFREGWSNFLRFIPPLKFMLLLCIENLLYRFIMKNYRSSSPFVTCRGSSVVDGSLRNRKVESFNPVRVIAALNLRRKLR